MIGVDSAPHPCYRHGMEMSLPPFAAPNDFVPASEIQTIGGSQ